MKLMKNNESVSEIMGTLLLLIVAVLVVTAIIITVISTLNDNAEPEVNIFGKLDYHT